MDRPIWCRQADLCGSAFDDGWSRALNHLFYQCPDHRKRAHSLSLLGIGYGLGNVALQAAMLKTSPSNMVGTTSGLFQTCRYLGSILSSVILGILFGKEITAAHFDMMGIIMIISGGASLLMAVRFAALMKTAS